MLWSKEKEDALMKKKKASGQFNVTENWKGTGDTLTKNKKRPLVCYETKGKGYPKYGWFCS